MTCLVMTWKKNVDEHCRSVGGRKLAVYFVGLTKMKEILGLCMSW